CGRQADVTWARRSNYQFNAPVAAPFNTAGVELHPVCKAISALGELTVREPAAGRDAGLRADPIFLCALPPSGHPRALLQLVDRGNDAGPEHPRLGVAVREEPVDATACVLPGLLAVAVDEKCGRRA